MIDEYELAMPEEEIAVMKETFLALYWVDVTSFVCCCIRHLVSLTCIL